MQRTGPQCSQTTQNQLGQKHAPPATSLVSALGSAAGPACAVRRSPLGRKMDRGRRKRERRSSAPPRLCKQLRDNFGGHVLCPGRLGESLSQCAWVIPFLTLEPLRTSPAWKPPGGYEGPGRPHFSLRALQGLAGTPTSALPPARGSAASLRQPPLASAYQFMCVGDRTLHRRAGQKPYF